MPQSLANVVLHLVFSTKNRQPVLTTVFCNELHPYLTGALTNLGCTPIQVGGVEDHVHLLFRMTRTKSIAEVAENLKTGSSKWLKTKGIPGFAWQSGYGVFSVGSNDLDAAAYVRNQPAHHARVSFQDGFRLLLQESGLEFDERYVWD
ncbi:IS200/IS605 family transposase [soil metagenome]